MAPTPRLSAEQQEIARLKEENERLKAATPKGVSFRVGDKGGVSVYGLGRFPVTLYQEQWATLFDNAPALQEFIEEHKSQLKKK